MPPISIERTSAKKFLTLSTKPVIILIKPSLKLKLSNFSFIPSKPSIPAKKPTSFFANCNGKVTSVAVKSSIALPTAVIILSPSSSDVLNTSKLDFKLNNTAPIAAAIAMIGARGANIGNTFSLIATRPVLIPLNALPNPLNKPLKPPSITPNAFFAPVTANVPALLIPSNTNFILPLPPPNT